MKKKRMQCDGIGIQMLQNVPYNCSNDENWFLKAFLFSKGACDVSMPTHDGKSCPDETDMVTNLALML